VMGYDLLRFHHRSSGNDYLILSEPIDALHRAKSRYWGTYVFHLGVSQSFVIQVPRPIFEPNSLEVAVALFETTQARALLIGGASPDANLDYAADILRLVNKENLFNTVNQALLREAGNAPLLVVQSRAMSERRDAPMPATDVIISSVRGAQRVDQMSPLGKRLLDTFARYDMRVSFTDGSAEMAGYEAGAIPQASYLNATQNKEMVVFWTSPLARASFLQQTEPTPQQAQAAALGLKTLNEDLAAYLARHGNRIAPLPTSLRQAMAPYFSSQDIVVLYDALHRHSAWQFERIVDPNSRQGYLSILDRNGALLGLINLTARDADTVFTFRPDSPRTSINAYIESRAAWLLNGASP
jgi:hypothetical protein